jgi:hypothetical protein
MDVTIPLAAFHVDRMVLCIPFQYIMDLIVIVYLRQEWLGYRR